jgi:outer membrane protein assembly factor BamB
MKPAIITLFTFFTCCWTAFPCQSQELAEEQLSNWGQWRGPLGTGVAPNATPPVRWSETENVKWKTELKGLGHSSPVVWKNYIFVTTAIPTGEAFEDPHTNDKRPGAHDNLPVKQKHKFAIVAISRESGEVLWQTEVHEAIPREGGHYTASLASASPVTDGKHVYASFGSFGVYCLDYKGQIVWEKQLGQMHTKHGHGEGASPALRGDKLIINWDHEEASFIVALNTADGTEAWKQQRDEVTSWSSPIIVKHEGSYQVIAAGTNRVRGYELDSGDVIWECGGLSNNVVATPVFSDGVVYVGSSYESRSVFAINIEGAAGDVTGTEKVLWKNEQRTPYVPSPLLYDGTLYYLRHYQGILTRLDAKTGEETIGPFRLAGMRDIYASPVAADGKMYFVDRTGVTLVVSHIEIPRVLGLNRLDDELSATPALVDNQIFLRGKRFLYCIE